MFVIPTKISRYTPRNCIHVGLFAEPSLDLMSPFNMVTFIKKEKNPEKIVILREIYIYFFLNIYIKYPKAQMISVNLKKK